MESSINKTIEVKIPKKRGRKPTGKIFQMEKGTVKNIETDTECIIAFLPLSMKDTKDISTNNSTDAAQLVNNPIFATNKFTFNGSNTVIIIPELSILRIK
jgi:hypothetical protein